MESHARDTPNRKIGRGKAMLNNTKSQHQKPTGKAILRLRGVVKAASDIATLLRFSKAVDVAYQTSLTAKTKTDGSDAGKKTKGSIVTVEKQTNEDGNHVFIIDIEDDRFWSMPSEKAVTLVFRWMAAAAAVPNASILPPLAPPTLDNIDFRLLCEVRAMTILLQLRPVPHQLLECFDEYHSAPGAILADLKAIHVTLPLHDPVMMGYIVSFFDHRERIHVYLHDEKEIGAYVQSEDRDLYDRFAQEQQSRNHEFYYCLFPSRFPSRWHAEKHKDRPEYYDSGEYPWVGAVKRADTAGNL